MKLLYVMISTLFALHASNDAVTNAPLNGAAKGRLRQNLETLEGNLQATNQNVEIVKKNILTLNEELSELNALEKEYTDLRVKYQSYIQNLEEEIKKNDTASDLLSGQGAVPTDSKNPTEEKQQRIQWKTEATGKLRKAQALLSSANESLKKIQARKSPILSQIQSQTTKQEEYAKTLAEIQSKKVEMERLLSSSK